MYVNYCHECGRALSSAQTERCDRCAWLRCECGACGCTYQGSGVRAVLATVPPVWGAVAPRHVASARPSSRRLRAAGPAFVFATVAVLLALGLAGVTSWLAPEIAVAPEVDTLTAVVDNPPEAVPNVAPSPVAADETRPVEAPAAAPETSSPPAAPPPAVEAPRPSSAEASRPASAEPARPAAAPAAAPTAGLPSVLYVGNTDGQGAFLRSQARDSNDTRMTAWTDGTAMTPLETTTVQEASGPATWVRVRDPKGNTGWIRLTYLRPSR